MQAGTREISVGPFRIGSAAMAAIVATLLFIALSAWWVLYDHRIPGGGDPGRQLQIALTFADDIKEFEPWEILVDGAIWGPTFFYPPFVHIVGALPAALGLAVEDWGVIAVNLVFVPLLALGCYRVGKLVYGPAAGLAAVIFALGTPMVISLFHVFLLDAPLAAITAVTLWALLASERFERRRETVIAGALIGVGLMVKPLAPLYVAGPVIVMLAAGGWRHWRNFVPAALAALAIAGPYYAIHLGDLATQSDQATGGGVANGNPFAAYDRLSVDNLTYYGWVAVNIQYLVPLLGLLAVGLVLAVRELRHRRHVPELLAGIVVGYLGPTLLLSIRDSRYTLPVVVYAAVLATGWLTTARRTWVAAAGAAVLVAAVVANLGAQTLPDVGSVRLAKSNHVTTTLQDPNVFTFVDSRGYVVGHPLPDSLWYDLLDAAEKAGVESTRINVRSGPSWGTDRDAFNVLATQRGIQDADLQRPPLRPDLVINVWYEYPGADEFWVGERGLAPPCGQLDEVSRISITPHEARPDSVPVNVSVVRDTGDGYERWCDF